MQRRQTGSASSARPARQGRPRSDRGAAGQMPVEFGVERLGEAQVGDRDSDGSAALLEVGRQHPTDGMWDASDECVAHAEGAMTIGHAGGPSLREHLKLVEFVRH